MTQQLASQSSAAAHATIHGRDVLVRSRAIAAGLRAVFTILRNIHGCPVTFIGEDNCARPCHGDARLSSSLQFSTA
jgi:hypothetical protein